MDTIIHLILGVVLGFVFRKKIESTMASFNQDLAAVDRKFEANKETVASILAEPMFQFEDSDWDIDDNNNKIASAQTIINLMEILDAKVISDEALETGFGISVGIVNKFNGDLIQKIPIFIPYSTFTKQDKKDKHFKAFRKYITYAKVWNALYTDYPTQLPYPANDKDSLLTFEKLHECISRTAI